MKIVISSIILCLSVFFSLCAAEIHLSIADRLHIDEITSQLEVPVVLSGVSDEKISGYILRLDYDDSVLTEPEISTDDTLSQGKHVEGAIPVDSLGGKYSVGLMLGLNNITDGVLVKIKFKILNHFVASPIGFIDAKTAFHTSNFSPVEVKSESSFFIRLATDQLSKIDYDETFMNNYSANVEGKSYLQGTDVQLSITGDIAEGSYIISGDNYLSPIPVIVSQEDYLIKKMLKQWYIVSSAPVPSMTLTFNINTTSKSPEHYWLSHSTDCETFSEICHADFVDRHNHLVIFHLPKKTLPEQGYYSLTFKKFTLQAPELHTSFKADKFNAFNYLTWRVNETTDTIGFNIWRKDLEDAFFTQINSNIIPVSSENSYKDSDVSSKDTFVYGLEYIYINASQNSFVDVRASHSVLDVNEDFKVDMGDVLFLFQEISLTK
jgi:hypothetical protein